MKELKLIQTRITPEIHKVLEGLAESQARSIASLLRMIVSDYVDTKEQYKIKNERYKAKFDIVLPRQPST